MLSMTMTNSTGISSKTWDLQEAVRVGDVELMREIIEIVKFDVNSELPNGTTSLVLAVQNQRHGVVQELIQLGADVNKASSLRTRFTSHLPYGYTKVADSVLAIQVAEQNEDPEMINLLLDAGGFAGMQLCKEGVNGLLKIAVKNNHKDLVSKLVYYNYNGQHPALDLRACVYLAIHQGSRDMLGHLISLGADVKREYQGLSPLVIAAEMEDIRMCLAILNNGASLDSSLAANSPLRLAIQAGLDKAVKTLLELGSQPNVTTERGTANFENRTGVFGTELPARSSLLHLAISKNNLAIVKLLIEAGADINRTNSIGDGPIHQLVYSVQDVNNLRIAKYMLTFRHGMRSYGERVIDIDAQNSFGRTPLIQAVMEKHFELAKLFIESGANLDIIDIRGHSVLHHCIIVENEDILLTAIRAGAKVDGIVSPSSCPRDKVFTAFHIAVLRKQEWAMDLLIEEGADTSILTVKGETPLHLAVMSKSIDIVERCLTDGYPINAVTARGDTAMTIAARQMGVHICQALLDAGAYLDSRDQNKETALSLSVYFGQEENAKLLIAEGADLDAGDNRGSTPIYWSTYNYRVPTLKCLLVAGAKFNRKKLTNAPSTISLSKDDDWKLWLEGFLSSIRSLQDTCRLVIRGRLKSIHQTSISKLLSKTELPKTLQDYLVYKRDPLFNYN